jgi:uncharacterized protein YxjI
VSETHAANWYPDPFGRHELRYWDGARWTEHVASHGRQTVDPPEGEVKTVLGSQSAEKVQRQIERANATETKRGGQVSANFAGNGSIFGEPVLVVNQKAKLIEINSEYAIYDRNGSQLGAIRQVGQSAAKKVVRFVANVDQFLTHKLQVVDMGGNVLLSVTRPAKFVKSKVVIADGAGRDIGEIVQENVFGKIRFGLWAGGQQLGGIYAENWRAWNFSIKDTTDTEVARVTKTFEGVAKTLFTTADNYVLQVHRPLEDPLRQLVVASALTIDTALKQDSRGLS